MLAAAGAYSGAGETLDAGTLLHNVSLLLTIEVASLSSHLLRSPQAFLKLKDRTNDE